MLFQGLSRTLSIMRLLDPIRVQCIYAAILVNATIATVISVFVVFTIVTHNIIATT